MDLQQGLQLIDGPIQLLDLHKLLGVTTGVILREMAIHGPRRLGDRKIESRGAVLPLVRAIAGEIGRAHV